MQGKRPLVVYMSGSAHSDWRDPVRAAYQDDPRVRFVGPCESHGLSDEMGAPLSLANGPHVGLLAGHCQKAIEILEGFAFERQDGPTLHVW
ncbi:MAG: YtoQ family protein, partial [Candidatus Poribacteria bacterium]